MRVICLLQSSHAPVYFSDSKDLEIYSRSLAFRLNVRHDNTYIVPCIQDVQALCLDPPWC